MARSHEDDGQEYCDDARQVLRLGECFEHSGRLVRAEIVEDGEVEDLERQQRGGQAEQLAGGTSLRGLSEWLMVRLSWVVSVWSDLSCWGFGETVWTSLV